MLAMPSTCKHCEDSAGLCLGPCKLSLEQCLVMVSCYSPMTLNFFSDCIKVIVADAVCSFYIGFGLEHLDTLSKSNDEMEIDSHPIISFIYYAYNVCVDTGLCLYMCM